MKKLLKKIICGVAALAVIAASAPLTGIDFSSLFTVESEAASALNRAGDYEIKNQIGRDYVYITKYYGNDIDVVIPSELKGKPVVGIRSDCFSGSTAEDATPEQQACAKIKSVTIPETVEDINARAFKGCVSLEKINFSEGLYDIDASAFEGCEKLTEINLPQTLSSFDGTALNGTAVEELVLPSYIEHISYKQYANTNVKRITAKGNANISYINSTNNVTEEIIVEGFMYAREVINDDEGVKNNALKRIVCKGGMEMDAQIELEAYGLYPHYEDDGTVIFTRTSDEYAETFVSGDYNYAVKNGNEAVITRYIGAGSDITVPESIDGYTVTEIADYAFIAQWTERGFRACNTSVIGREQITSITLPATVNEIGAYAFAFNKALKTINIPEGITVIPHGAFMDAEALESISIPSVTKILPMAFCFCISLKNVESGNVKEIGSLAFDSTALTSFDFSDGLEKIGHYAFADCKNLQTAMLPDSLTQLGMGSFLQCNSLETVTLGSAEKIPYECFVACNIRFLVIPDSVTEVGDYAFDCNDLRSLTLSNNLKKIGFNAFSGTEETCKENYSTLYIPHSVEYIDEGAFMHSGFGKIIINGTNLEIDAHAFAYSKFSELKIGSGVKSIGVCAFFKNLNLVKLEIENGVERIDTYAFSYCQNLQKIEIPESVNYFGKEAFYPCKRVETIVFNAADYTCYSDYLPPEYQIFDGRNVTELIIGDGVKKIYEGTFCNFEKITELTIPDSVTEIEDFAFYTCPKLEKLILSKNLHTIGDSAFYECLSLKDLVLPESLQIIEEYAFDSCKSLNELVLPESIQSIGYYAFADGAFTSLTFPEGLQTLSGKAFAGCKNVTEINFYSANCKFTNLTSSNISGLYYSPFYGLSNLKTVNLGENIKELPAYLFCGIDSIDEIVLPSTVTDVGVWAFAFSGITSFKATDSLESIEEFAFYGCTKLESVETGNKIILIGAGAFTGCNKLTEIYIPDTVTNIEMDAFKNCSALQTVRMSPNVDYIPREAFYNCKELSTFTWDSDSKLVGRLAFGNCVKLTDFDFMNVEKLYVNSFLGSGVNIVQLGETENEASLTPLTTVEVQSFMDCDNLATLGIGGNVTAIKTQAFANCENLETAVIADSVTEIAEDAFDGCDKLTIYCSENSYAHTYAQTQGIRVSTLVIAPIPNQTYTGFEIKPEISVSASGDTLDKNIDFSVSYANNVNVGNADVNVKGLGDFRMFASRAMFTIVTKNVSAVTVSPIADQPYTGSAITPELTVTDGLKVLSEGKDYTVTFSNNVNEGTATAKITGIGNYSGTATADFVISKEAEEPSFFERIISTISSFFAKVISFFVSIFM